MHIILMCLLDGCGQDSHYNICNMGTTTQRGSEMPGYLPLFLGGQLAEGDQALAGHSG